MNGGAVVARTLRRHGVEHLFTLCGGHISPILVESKRLGIRIKIFLSKRDFRRNQMQMNRFVATTLTLFRALVGMETFRTADFHTGFLDQLLASGDLDRIHGEQDPEAEHAAMMAAACLATATAGRLPDGLFDHGDESEWWDEGTRVLHGRFPR